MFKLNILDINILEKLKDHKYVYRDDINDKDSLELNFRKQFEALNYVNLTDNEFRRLFELNIKHFLTLHKIGDRLCFKNHFGQVYLFQASFIY